ncbi:MAG TPA: hypothetical protein QGF58_18420 [Myxococcota bacterium]|nr:hypothetical protein [Myxococcota bacterium]
MHEDNLVRYVAGAGGHVESWFLRANDPDSRRAFWLKTTLLQDLEGRAVAEAWCCTFDGADTWGGRSTVPLGEARLVGPLVVGACEMDLEAGTCRGEIGDRSWDLRFERAPAPLAAPLCMMPMARMKEWPVPRSKLLTPAPALLFSGTMSWGGQEVAIEQWPGMQGHNWGKEHAHTYAWGQCLFSDDEGVFAMVEAFSGRLAMAGRLTPFISGMVVRRGDRVYRWDRLVDLWNQEPEVHDTHWRLRLRGPDGDAELRMRALPDEMVTLGYRNPDEHLSYCFNSKLAEVELVVNPTTGDGFTCRSPHGGALEMLRREPNPRFGEVV